MIPQELLKLISSGESMTVEFKKSRTEVTKDVYETVCAFPLTEVATATVGPSAYVITDGEINGEINLSETDQKVLSAIRKNPYIKRQELITSLEIGKSTLDRSLKRLKGMGVLNRIGSNKTGYWKC